MRCVIALLAFLLSVDCVFANIHSIPLQRSIDKKYIFFEDIKINLESTVEGVFGDEEIHHVNGKRFVLILQFMASNPTNPMGRCGAGNEVFAVLYRLENKKVIPFQKFPVSSCLRGYYLESQFFSDNDQEYDFSSIKWSSEGISVDWYLGGGKKISAEFNLKGGIPEFAFYNALNSLEK